MDKAISDKRISEIIATVIETKVFGGQNSCPQNLSKDFQMTMVAALINAEATVKAAEINASAIKFVGKLKADAITTAVGWISKSLDDIAKELSQINL